MAGAVMGAVVVIGVALSFTLGGRRTDRYGNPEQTHPPGVGMYVAIVVIGLVAAILIHTVGYRIPALRPDLDPAAARGRAIAIYQQSTILRFALSESVAIVTIALLFAGRSKTILPYVVAAAIAEALMAYHVWPSRSLIKRVQQRLDRDAGRSDLAGALFGAP